MSGEWVLVVNNFLPLPLFIPFPSFFLYPSPLPLHLFSQSSLSFHSLTSNLSIFLFLSSYFLYLPNYPLLLARFTIGLTSYSLLPSRFTIGLPSFPLLPSRFTRFNHLSSRSYFLGLLGFPSYPLLLFRFRRFTIVYHPAFLSHYQYKNLCPSLSIQPPDLECKNTPLFYSTP